MPTKMTPIALLLLALASPLTARADFWSDDTGRFNDRLGDFNRTFEIAARGVIDRASFEKVGHSGDSSYFTDSTHWPSYLCGASVIREISDQFYTTHAGNPTAVRIGLKRIKTIHCAAGAAKNVTVSGDAMTIVLDDTSGQNDPPMVAEAMLHAFPAVAWDDAELDIQDALAHVNESCGTKATFSYDKTHIDAVSYLEHVTRASTACGDVLTVFIVGCQHNAKVKAAVQKVTSFVCTGGPERAVRVAPTQVKLFVTGYKPDQYRIEGSQDRTDEILAKAVPGAEKSWTW